MHARWVVPLQFACQLVKLWASDPLIAQLSQVPSLTLTIWDDKEQSIAVKELGNMSLPEFAKIYSVSLLALLIKSAAE